MRVRLPDQEETCLMDISALLLDDQVSVYKSNTKNTAFMCEAPWCESNPSVVSFSRPSTFFFYGGFEGCLSDCGRHQSGFNTMCSETSGM